jgi:hypothetical protein
MVWVNAACEIPPSAIGQNGLIEIQLVMNEGLSPAQLTLGNDDHRLLGLMLQSIRFSNKQREPSPHVSPA